MEIGSKLIWIGCVFIAYTVLCLSGCAAQAIEFEEDKNRNGFWPFTLALKFYLVFITIPLILICAGIWLK